MTQQHPLVSVGLPVRNGANFLAQALESRRAQTLHDLEVVVSDNASTDSTPEIIARASAVDPRVRSFRQDENVGAAANFNLVFDAARGKYFCWAAHDDLWSPEFLARCAEILETDSGAILCFAGCAEIDPELRELKRLSERPDLGFELPHVRLRDVVQHATVRPIFGLVRIDALRRTRRMQPHLGGDRALLAELALQGRFREIPETLFFSRQHPHRYGRTIGTRDQRGQWWSPSAGGGRSPLLPHWTRLVDYGSAIHRVPMPRDERPRCWAELLVEARRRWRPLVHDLGVAGRDLLPRRARRRSASRL